MTEAELILRIARMLKQEVAPAVTAEYPRTQAFMAAVVLQKLGRQLESEPLHGETKRSDLDALVIDLGASLACGEAPMPVRDAFVALTRSRDEAALCRLIEALYEARADLGEERFGQLLARIRRTLRTQIDRRMEYSG